ncbi:hypothetical protein, partial [Ornithobacterium rhinotracheale]
LSDNCYYRVGSNYFTPASFNAFLKTVKDDYLFFTRLIPLDNQEVKNLIDDSDHDHDILSIHPVGNYLDGFEIKKDVEGYHFFNRTEKYIGVYLDNAGRYGDEITSLNPGQDFKYNGTGPFIIYDGNEEIWGIE